MAAKGKAPPTVLGEDKLQDKNDEKEQIPQFWALPPLDERKGPVNKKEQSAGCVVFTASRHCDAPPSWDLKRTNMVKDGIVLGPPVMFPNPGVVNSSIMWKTKLKQARK